jgi:predicted transposase YbfD/YdcC
MSRKVLEKLKHLKKKKRIHLRTDLKIIQILEDVPDPRGFSCNFSHPLTTILFITIVSSLCGANNWELIVVQAEAMSEWISQYVDLSGGIPCARTFKRVFEALCPDAMERMLIRVMELMREKKGREAISFDGKTLRGTAVSERGLKGIHLLNAWSHENGICIGQVRVEDKSNEITAMPELMELLDLKGTIITADALNTQKDIVQKAIEKGADYILPVKGNHAGLLEEIELMFKGAEDREFKGIDAETSESVDKLHGRIEERGYYSIGGEDLPSAEEWAGLRSLGKVERTRIEKERQPKSALLYLEQVTRGHWGIENGLHWMLVSS